MPRITYLIVQTQMLRIKHSHFHSLVDIFQLICFSQNNWVQAQAEQPVICAVTQNSVRLCINYLWHLKAWPAIRHVSFGMHSPCILSCLSPQSVVEHNSELRAGGLISASKASVLRELANMNKTFLLLNYDFLLSLQLYQDQTGSQWNMVLLFCSCFPIQLCVSFRLAVIPIRTVKVNHKGTNKTS